MRTSVILTAALGLLAAGSFGCSLTIDKTFAMQPGSSLDLSLTTADHSFEVPQGPMVLEGAAVMRIALSTTILDYLDGTVDGDIELLDVLFGVPNIRFLIIDTGPVCVVLGDPPGGGTFSYNTLAQQATFDALINTKAVPTNAGFASLLRGGALAFPFDLQSTIPLSLVDGLGLFTGVSAVSVTQAIDTYYDVALLGVDPNDPSQDSHLTIHAKGEVTLQTTDTFPVTPTVTTCLDFLSSGA